MQDDPHTSSQAGKGSLSCLVVGGGIGGLTAAIALRQRGLHVVLIEREPQWSVYGVGIIQQSNVVRAMAQLGLLEEYLARGFGFDTVRMFAPNGDQVAAIPSPKLAGTAYPANVGISRRVLNTILAERADSLGADIRLGVTAASFEETPYGVMAHFSGGDAQHFDVVIGADGVQSGLRGIMFPTAAGPAYTGQSVWRYNLPRPSDLHSLDVYSGRNGIGLVPLSEQTMYMYLTTAEPSDQRLPQDGLAAAMRERLANAPPRIAALRSQIHLNEEVVYRPLQTILLEGPWHRGRFVLLGDAVHATTPHLGQGGGMAIEDSIVLAEEIEATPADPEAAFQRYRDRRIARCRFIVESSIAVGDYQLGKRDSLDYPGLTRQMFEITSAPL